MFSQYKPIDTVVVEQKKQFVKSLKDSHVKKIERFKQYEDRKIRKEITSIFNNQYNYFLKDIEKGELYFYDKYDSYLNEILREIVKHNSVLKNKPLKVFLSRNTDSNAYSYGDGTLVIHLQILKSLEKEGQLASIICHEIAHYILSHKEKSIEDYANKIYSEEFKKEVKKIKKGRYSKYSKTKKLLEKTIYSRKHKSREHEYEADSLGFVYLRNTKYRPSNFIETLEVLKTIDIEKDSLKKDFLIKTFTTPNQKFNKDWFFAEDYSSYYYNKPKKWEIDSLRTHPNCENRILRIKKMRQKKNNGFKLDEDTFQEMKRNAVKEEISNLYYFKNYGKGTYKTLIALQKESNDKFLLKMFGLFIEQLYIGKNKMALNRYLPLINPTEQTNSEQQFINVMVNMSKKELKEISTYYNTK